MISIFIAFGVFLITIIVVIYLYNKLVTSRNRMQEAWSGIDVYLKKRHDLVPALVTTVKGYATHEKETFEEVTRCRSSAMQAKGQEARIELETGLEKALGQLMVVAESYPDLKANINFLELQKQLSQIEEDLSYARRYYNGTVREQNIKIESFPSNVVANMFRFDKGTFFEIDKTEKMVPNVSI
ncbi:MAG: LemA family protein [Bacteroidales bacterium]|nr:LemA family protein [Bacteroidales bacterium]